MRHPLFVAAVVVAAVTVVGCEKGMSSSQRCVEERDMVEKAIENFAILENRDPATEAEMVPTYLRAESALMDLGAGATVVAAPGSGCT